MDDKKKKCSFIEHKEIDAINYCAECKRYMCNKCSNYHKGFLENHLLYKIDKDIEDIFTGFCKEENHIEKLEYLCKTHNKLCCVACLCKIKDEIYGQHKDCDVCKINDIKDEKKNKLGENIKFLEELSINLQNTIKELKILLGNVNKNKEELKLKIQNIFTKIRNILNNREDELLLEVDKKFNKLYCNEEIIKQSENLPNKIKISLEKGKIINNEWNNNNKLNSLINDCINIENNIKDINNINEIIKNINLNKNIKIKFVPEEENNYGDLLESIKIFGKICYDNFKFRKCPNNIKENRKYIISGEQDNIITKTGSTNWMGTICENELEKGKEYKWKIKILKTYNYDIMVGVAPNDFDINSSVYNTCGWYFYFYNSCIYSGPPHNYGGKSTNLMSKKDEIIVIMNMNKRTLKFIINNEDKGESFTDIPIDKPLYPAVLLYHQNDSVEINEC